MSKTRPAPDRAGSTRPGGVRAGSARPAPGRAGSSGRRRRRRAATLLVVIALVAAGGFFGARALLGSVVTPQCTITAAARTETFDPDQAGNAALIAAVSLKRDLPPRAATI